MCTVFKHVKLLYCLRTSFLTKIVDLLEEKKNRSYTMFIMMTNGHNKIQHSFKFDERHFSMSKTHLTLIVYVYL